MNSSKILHTPKATKRIDATKSLAGKLAAASALPFANVGNLSFSKTPKQSKSEQQSSSKSKATTSSSQAGSGPSTIHSLEIVLPETTVLKIMKTSSQVEDVDPDALYLITKSTELFINYMASQAFKKGNSKTLEYDHLAELARTENWMDFLKEMIPRKVSAQLALQEMAKQKEGKEQLSDST